MFIGENMENQDLPNTPQKTSKIENPDFGGSNEIQRTFRSYVRSYIRGPPK